MKFKDIAISDASPEAKVAALAILLDKELLKLAETVLNVQSIEGAKGEQGLQGPKGEQGDRGFDGTNGKDGANGADGRDGEVGKQGVGVQDAKIDFDGSLVITLTDGTEINAGEVVSLDTAEKIRVIGNGGGTSQSVLDAINVINAVISTYGTMALQNKVSVDIEGGTIDNTVIGSTTPAAGTFTTLIGGKDQTNYAQIKGGATTKAVEFITLGTDTNIAAVIKSKGTGAIDLAAGSSGVNISNGGTVTALTMTTNGSTAYTSHPTPAITAPTTAGGVQATAASNLYYNSAIALTTIVSGGVGYTVSDVLTVSGGTFTAVATFTVSAVSGGVVTAVTATAGGTYSVIPTGTLSVTGGTGSGFTFTINGWAVRSLSITNAGSGYVEQPTVSFSGGGGSGAAAYASVGSTTLIRSLGPAMDFYTPAGIGFRVGDAGATSTYYWQALGGAFNGILRGGGSTQNALIQTGGTGGISLQTNNGAQTQMIASHTASAVNYVQVTGAATGARPTISSQGSDATLGLNIQAKGTSNINFLNNNGSNTIFVANGNAGTVVNYLQSTAAVASSAPSLSSQGSDTNIDLILTPKGTGNVRFGTYTANMGLLVQGYIEIKDSGGTVRKLAVIA